MTVDIGVRTYPFSQPNGLDLDPVYREMRAQGLIRVQLPFGDQAWLATSYADVKAVMNDPRFSRARSVSTDEPRILPVIQRANVLMTQDPPHHDRLRRLVAKAFTKRRIEELRPRIQRITDGLLDRMEQSGAPADFITHVAAPLPALAVCEMLGVPTQDRDRFVALAESLLTRSISLSPIEQIVANGRQLWAYFAGLAELRRQEPADDLMTSLVQARDADESRLTADELVALAVTVLVGGHDAATMQIGNFAYQILSSPEHLRQLQEHPELVPDAVEELTRYSAIGVGTSSARYATEDITIGDVVVREGEYVLIVIGSANRDENVFPDPERIDFTRQSKSHLGFGFGLHRCLGAALARVQLQVALGSLLRRFPAIRLAVSPGEVQWSTGLLPRSAVELPLAW